MSQIDSLEVCPNCKSTKGYEYKNGAIYCISCGWEKKAAEANAILKSRQEKNPFTRIKRIIKPILLSLFKLTLIVFCIAISISLLGIVLGHFYGPKNQSEIKCGYGNLTLRECYHPFWSWFSRDSLFIYGSGVIIQKKSFSKKETIEIPSTKIDRLQIKSGIFEKSVIIKETKYFSTPLKLGIRTKKDMDQVYHCLQFLNLPYTIEYDR